MNLGPPQVHASVLLAWNKCICGSCRGVVEERIHRCGIYGAWPVVMGAVAVVRVREYSRASPSGHAESLCTTWHASVLCRGTRSHGTTSHARGVGGWGWGAWNGSDPTPASDDLLVLGALWSSLLSRVFVRELRAIRETVERAVTGRCRHMAHGC